MIRQPIPTSAILIGVLMIAASVLAHMAKPTQYLANVAPHARLSEELPKHIEHWKKLQIDDIEIIDPTRQAVLNYLYTDLLSASYLNTSNQLVMLSIAYGKDQSDGHNVHKPSICYPAQGFTITDERDIPLTLDKNRQINVHYMYTQNGQRTEPLIYWTTAGDFLYQSTLQRKIIEFKYSGTNLIPDGMILRISTLEKEPTIAINILTKIGRAHV